MQDDTQTPQNDTHNQEVKAVASRDTLMQALKREADERLTRIDKEFADGFELLHNYTDTVTIFGSARFEEGHPYYQKAREISKMLAEEGYTVVTGGGGGIMEAGNRGAYEANGDSLGLNIELPHEQALNSYTTASLPFRYFFARKVLLAYEAQAYICLPGGYGTLDEFFEIITLIQTGKIDLVPVILVGHEFWSGLDDFIRYQLLDGWQTISSGDEKLYTITEDTETIKQIIETSRRSKMSDVLGADTAN